MLCNSENRWERKYCYCCNPRGNRHEVTQPHNASLSTNVNWTEGEWEEVRQDSEDASDEDNRDVDQINNKKSKVSS